jgi:hypothetical protein
VQPNQNQSLSAIRDYDELVSTLERLVARSHVDGFDATPIGEPWRQNVDPFCTVAPVPGVLRAGPRL